jgi:glyoxylase-like metal-dependent hydrolase (beta-lactamase superfamily II)
MKQLAEGVWQLSGFPPNSINVYVLDDVLIDAATRYSTRRIIRQAGDHGLTAHALTHAHPDHQGASHSVCERLGLPFWVGEGDVEPAENPELIGQRQPDHFMAQFFARTMTGPGHPVDRRLREGDSVGSFKVLDTPGHSAGHVSLWREADGVLVLGDVLNSADVYTGIPGLRQPRDYFTPDPAENRRSAKRLGELEPKLVLFGHGPPVRDTRKFTAFTRSLPD